MYLAVAQLRQLLQCLAAILIVLRQHTQGYQHLVSMQTWILGTQVFGLRLLYWFDEALRNELCLVVDACQVFGGIQQQGGTTAEQRRRLGGDDGTVLQLNGCCCVACLNLLFVGLI